MFEQAILADARGGARCTSFAASAGIQILLVGTALMVPLFFIENPSVARLHSMVMAPPSPPPPPAPIQLVPAPRTVIARMFDGARLIAPIRIPAQAAGIVEEIASAPQFGSVGVPGGTGNAGTSDGVLGSILRTAPDIAPPPPAPRPNAMAQKDDPPPVAKRVTVSSGVQSAKLIHRVMPVYPPLARQARISGVVKLMGIISREGRIMQLQVLSGHPLLVGAAVDAVRQWIYQPTLLNQEPVEVVAPIDVNFILAQ
jgi:protein TonB